MARYDVIVVGGGVAGAIAALTVARQGRRTAIVDAPASHQMGEGLADSAADVLVRFGLGRLLDEADHVRCHGVRYVTGDGSTVHPWPGFILDRAKFGSDLMAAAVASGCARLCGEASGVTADPAGKGLTIWIETQHGLTETGAALVIDATGRKAALARRLGASRKVLTNLAAAWAMLPAGNVGVEPGTLAVEAAGAHWWYVAAGRHGVAAAMLGRRPSGDLASWLAAARSTNLLAGLAPSTPVSLVMRPANVSALEPVCGEGWLACGDAAATFDPLSGYGLSFAIGTGYAAGRSADALLRGDRLAQLTFSQLVSDRVVRAWSGWRRRITVWRYRRPAQP